MRTPQELDRLREQAVALRRQGKSRRQIKEILGPMSNVTLNYALKEEPPPEWTRRPNAKDEIGDVTSRELVIAGAIAYSCEGSKNRPGPWNDHVAFTNSDPALIRFFLRFLEAIGTPQEDVTFRIYIHESADVESAQRFWLEATGASPDQFRTPTLKRHNPRTVRKKVGEGYYGCLRIDVRRSSGLFHKIEGWAAGIMSGTWPWNGQVPNPHYALPGEDSNLG